MKQARRSLGGVCPRGRRRGPPRHTLIAEHATTAALVAFGADLPIPMPSTRRPELTRTMPARLPSPGRRTPNRRCWAVSYATRGFPMPATCGHSAPPPPRRRPWSTTAPRTPKARPITRCDKLSATPCLASSTAAQGTAAPTPRASSGHTAGSPTDPQPQQPEKATIPTIRDPDLSAPTRGMCRQRHR